MSYFASLSFDVLSIQSLSAYTGCPFRRHRCAEGSGSSVFFAASRARGRLRRQFGAAHCVQRQVYHWYGICANFFGLGCSHVIFLLFVFVQLRFLFLYFFFAVVLFFVCGAISDHRTSVVRELLVMGSNARLSNKAGETPIMLASELSLWGCVRWLISFGASLSDKGAHHAHKRTCFQGVSTLLNRTGVHSSRTVFMLAQRSPDGLQAVLSGLQLLHLRTSCIRKCLLQLDYSASGSYFIP